MATIKNTSANRAKLTKQLKSAQSTLKGLNPTDSKSKGLIRQSSDMLSQTRKEGGASFADSSYNTKDYIPTQSISETDLTTPTQEIATYQAPDIGAAGILGSFGTGDVGNTALETSQKNQSDLFEQMQELIGAPPSQADILKKLEKDNQIQQKQEAVNLYQGQLNNIVANSQANQLQVVGQGRGIPEAIIGGQQAQIARESAIAALPVAAQLSAAQGNLEMAQSHVDKLFAVKSADAQAQYQYRAQVIKSVYEFASNQEQQKLDYVMKLEDRKYTETQNDLNYGRQLAGTAFQNNQSALAGQIMSLDSKSPTYKQDLARLSSQIYDPAKALDTEIKRKQLEALTAGGGKEKVTINGVDYWQDAQGNLSIPTIPTGTSDSKIVLQSANKVEEIAGFLKSDFGIGSSSGFLKQSKVLPPGYIMEIKDWRAGVKNLIAGTTLGELADAKAKGITFGALSEGEIRLVADASGKLAASMDYEGSGDNKVWKGTFSLSEAETRKQLGILEQYAKLDFERRAGIPYEDYITGNYAQQIEGVIESTSNPYGIYTTTIK